MTIAEVSIHVAQKAIVNCLVFYQESHMAKKKIRVIDDIVPHDGPLRSDGTQHATEKQVKIF